MNTKREYFFSNPTNAKKAAHIGQRKKNGIKITISIKPIVEGIKHRAYALFEGKEYEVFAKSNSEARDKLFLKLDSIQI